MQYKVKFHGYVADGSDTSHYYTDETIEAANNFDANQKAYRVLRNLQEHESWMNWFISKVEQLPD